MTLLDEALARGRRAELLRAVAGETTARMVEAGWRHVERSGGLRGVRWQRAVASLAAAEALQPALPALPARAAAAGALHLLAGEAPSRPAEPTARRVAPHRLLSAWGYEANLARLLGERLGGWQGALHPAAGLTGGAGAPGDAARASLVRALRLLAVSGHTRALHGVLQSVVVVGGAGAEGGAEALGRVEAFHDTTLRHARRDGRLAAALPAAPAPRGGLDAALRGLAAVEPLRGQGNSLVLAEALLVGRRLLGADAEPLLAAAAEATFGGWTRLRRPALSVGWAAAVNEPGANSHGSV